MAQKRQKTPRQKLPSARVAEATRRPTSAPALETGELRVVATPLGNRADLSPRAADALATSDALLCEDTRRTHALLTSLGIMPRGWLERFDAHVEHGGGQAIARWVERLRAGERLALVSDAGTPAISDPGALLVAAAREAGVRVVPIAGPSAVTAAVSAAGWDAPDGFSFIGFLPRAAQERKTLFRAFREATFGPSVLVWFESPERIEKSLEDLSEADPESQVCAFKEISKTHERAFRGTSAQALEEVRALEREDPGAWQGEWVVVQWLGRRRMQDQRAQSGVNGDAWRLALRTCMECGISPSFSAKIISQNFAVPRGDVYALALEISGKKNPAGD